MFLFSSYSLSSKIRCRGDVSIAALVGHEDMPATNLSTETYHA